MHLTPSATHYGVSTISPNISKQHQVSPTSNLGHFSRRNFFPDPFPYLCLCHFRNTSPAHLPLYISQHQSALPPHYTPQLLTVSLSNFSSPSPPHHHASTISNTWRFLISELRLSHSRGFLWHMWRLTTSTCRARSLVLLWRQLSTPPLTRSRKMWYF